MIKIETLSKTYKENKVIKNISININHNSSIALLGPNGSGKTTLIKILLGLVQPDANSKIYLNETTIDFNLPKYLKIGYISQSPMFPLNLKVKDLIDYLILFENEYPKNLDDLMKDLNINSFINKKVYELSGGMKQKINILQCFMIDRQVYLLDEPTISLDPYHSLYLKQKIKEKKSNSTIIFTTHILNEVEELADEMFILIDGELRLNANPSEFIKSKNSKNLEEALSNIKDYIKI